MPSSSAHSINPKFITLEGGDGAGKTTQIKLLVERLRVSGIDVVQTREPGGCPQSETIRDLLVKGAIDRWDRETEVLLHYAARKEHMIRTIQPALHKGQWVVSDRFADSTLAYQGYGMGVDLGYIQKIHDAVVGNFAPDLTIILDIDPEVAVKRSAGHASGEDRYENMDMDFQNALRAGFLTIAEKNSTRCVVVDAADSADNVHEKIWHEVENRLLK